MAATDIDAVKAALREAAATTASSATGAMGAAMATAGLAKVPAGQQQPKVNLSDAGSLAATAKQAADAATALTDALAKLETAFPTPPPPPPTEPAP